MATAFLALMLFAFFFSMQLLGVFGTIWICMALCDVARQRGLRRASAKRMREWEAYRLDQTDCAF